MQSVAERMTPHPTTIEPTASALAALDLVVDAGIRHLPVVDTRARLVGVISIDDLRAALPFAVSLRRPPGVDEREIARDVSVAEVMTHGPITAMPITTVAEAAATLVRHRIVQRELRQWMARGRTSLLIGLSFLALCLVVATRWPGSATPHCSNSAARAC